MGFMEAVIPIVMFLVIGGIWAGSILAKHRERMTLIDKGLSPEDIRQMYRRGAVGVNPLVSLKWGMVFAAIGLAIILGLWIREFYFVDEGIYFALIALFGGVGLITFYAIARKKISAS